MAVNAKFLRENNLNELLFWYFST